MDGGIDLNKYFYCYSYPLKEFLLSNGQVSILHAKHPSTDKKYWVFEGNDNLNKLLTDWKLRKH